MTDGIKPRYPSSYHIISFPRGSRQKKGGGLAILEIDYLLFLFFFIFFSKLTSRLPNPNKPRPRGTAPLSFPCKLAPCEFLSILVHK